MLSEKANAELLAYLSDFDILTTGPFDYADRITIRCKTCGAVLNRVVNGIFDNAIAHDGKYACVECKKLYNQRPEVKRAKYRENGRRQRERKRPQKEAAKQKRNAEELERRKQVVKCCGDFEYVGNYTGSDGTADIRCLKCGAIITRSWITIRHANVTCDNCELIAREQRKQEREQERQADVERKRRNIEEERNEAYFKGKQKQLAFSICIHCGAIFFTNNPRQRCCSMECGRAIHYAAKKDRRLRRMKNANDAGITLKKLYNRDNGVCYLCGELCDWNDYTQTDKAFIAGDAYPSIDHVVPLSAGGRHTWDNVRLAHRACNYQKRDIPL